MKRKPSIIIDTREQKPWSFDGYREVHKELKTGDYTFHGYSKLMVVERKSLADWVNCCGKWAKFKKKQLDKLAKLRHSIIIVEGDPSLVRWGKYGSPQSVVSGAIQAIQDGVPVLFCGTRDIARFACIHWLEETKKIIDSA